MGPMEKPGQCGLRAADAISCASNNILLLREYAYSKEFSWLFVRLLSSPIFFEMQNNIVAHSLFIRRRSIRSGCRAQTHPALQVVRAMLSNRPRGARQKFSISNKHGTPPYAPSRVVRC